MNLLVIYNPHAASGKARKLLPHILSYIKQAGLNATLLTTEYSGHAVELVSHKNLNEFDAVVASGGDGTLFEVLNGYQKNPAKDKPPLGLIPNGTGNAFMKELRLHRADWRKAIDIIARNQTRSIDIGRFETEGNSYHFINIVGMGFVSDVAESAVSFKWMGNAAYTVATLRNLVKLQSQKMIIEVDGKKFERQGVFVEVANSTYTGTTFLMAPKAKLDDGLLDVIILNDITKFRMLKLFRSIYDGSHIHYDEVEYLQAKSIKIIEEKPGQLIPDGEVLGKTPVAFECLPNAIEFLWDPDLL
ncbi:diacylglycerol kinase family lipid kinase [Aliikangiella marina]|uniref:Diacylglycerol kinase family lipid kinase n=1 Tax=Aliikangiella marina TaxID=1712262 RepID=A0A545T550_9GAMM|nr:diacylglycerol kinase family protein [Aliikangiella marina]TQV72315.1 diacylglycerol kinase family lipid kinase [Aliikangiella marina]